MEKQANVISKSCYYQISYIVYIKRSITRDIDKILAYALITSPLNYGNGLLYGMPRTLMTRLQRVHNSTAGIVNCAGKRNHITAEWATSRIEVAEQDCGI